MHCAWDDTGFELCGGKRFFSSPNYPDRVWGPPGCLFNGLWGSFTRSKRPGLDDNSPPSSAKIRNEYSCTSTPSRFLHGANRDNLPYYELRVSWISSPWFEICRRNILRPWFVVCLQYFVIRFIISNFSKAFHLLFTIMYLHLFSKL
jgi:hypothetical protein